MKNNSFDTGNYLTQRVNYGLVSRKNVKQDLPKKLEEVTGEAFDLKDELKGVKPKDKLSEDWHSDWSDWSSDYTDYPV